MGVLGRLGRPDFFNPTLVPRGAFELDRTHPLARGLIAAWIPGSIYKWSDLVDTPYAEIPTGIKYAVGPRGPVADLSAIAASGGVATSFNTALTDCTFETSAYIPSSPSGWDRIADKKTDTGMWLGRIGAFSGVWGGGFKQISYPTGQGVTITEGAWHQLLLSRSGTTQVVSADGDATTGSWSCDGSALDTTALKIGYNANSLEIFAGLLERLFIFNRALSAGERMWLYREPYAMFRPVVRRIWSTPPAGATNITATKATWIWAGTASVVNAKQMLAATKQPWVWSPQVPNVNAKTMFAAIKAPWVWSPGIPSVNAKTMLQATKAPWVWFGTAVNFTNGTAITLIQQAWVWAGTALNVNAKTMISAVSQAWVWAGTAAVVNAKTAITTIKAPWVWAGQAATVTAQTSLTLVKQAWVWAGNVPGVSYIQHASLVGVSWIWRGIRLRGSRSSSQGVVGGVLSGVLRGVMQLPSRWKK